MFGEELEGESPRLPSPWLAVAGSGTSTPAPCESDVTKALEILRLENASHLKLAPESDQEGQIEYKLRLAAGSNDRFDKLVSQLKWRMLEGGGTCLYELGVLDDGHFIGLPAQEMSTTLETLQDMASELDAHVEILREIQLTGDDIYLNAKRTNLDRNPTGLVSSSLVVQTQKDTEVDAKLGSTQGPSTTLVSDTPSLEGPAKSAPIDIAPLRKAVTAAASAQQQQQQPKEDEQAGHKEEDEAGLSGSFSLSTSTTARQRSGSGEDGSGEASRCSTPLRSLPAGRRYCLEVRITMNSEADEPAFLNFEGWSME